ncbi:MAG: ABC transporter permease [Planctomycetes bacterium]|nr:ABC transporter permease [Planctomycetota bacterium]
MTLLTLVRRGIAQRRLSSVLTALSAGVGVALVVAILLLRASLEKHFMEPGRGYSLVVGPPGSRLQLVLNSVYHLDRSSGLVPWSVYEELKAHPSVRLAVPYAVGDSFRGYRVVGTTEALFDAAFPHPAGIGAAKLAAGRPFVCDADALAHAIADMRSGAGAAHDHGHDHAEAVIGAEVAEALDIGVGALIEPTHGVEGGKEHKDEHLWTVVGVLKPTGTPVDRVVFIDLASFYAIPDHAGGVIGSNSEVGLSSILLFPKPGIHKALLLPRLMNRSEFGVAEVAAELQTLFHIVGRVDSIYLITAALVTVLGVISIMVAIYNSMAARKREIAILRAVGAHRRTVFGVVVLEAVVITFVGALAGLIGGHVLVLLGAGAVQSAAGFAPQAGVLWLQEGALLLLVTLLGACAGVVPALHAYREDIATGLAPQS